MKPTTRYFWAGWLIHMASMSLYQDWIGKEAYLEKAARLWIDAAITVPLSLAVIAFAAYMMNRADKELKGGSRSSEVLVEETETVTTVKLGDGFSILKRKHGEDG